MKTLKIFFLLTFGIGILHANERPETIPSKLTELKNMDWYQDRYNQWLAYLNEFPSDKNGWVELFRSAQYSGVENEELLKIANEISQNHPNSSQSHFVQFKIQGWNEKGMENLEAAIELGDQNDFLEEELLMEEFNFSEKRSLFSKMVMEKKMIYKSTLNYAYNVLMSVSEGGILVTEATHTTIPLWVLQDVMSVRKDVKIINLELSSNENYLQRKLKEYSLNPSASIFQLADSNPEEDFFFALTLTRKNLHTIDNKLYVVGLASQFESDRLDHFSTLKENLENRFLLDYLTIDFNGEPNTSTGNSLQANYIVPFVLLKEYYDEIGDFEKSKSWLEELLSIADRSQLRPQVERLLLGDNVEARNYEKIDLDIKMLDKHWKNIKDNIYASEFEMNNRDYELFLKYLEEQEHDDLLEIADIDLSQYEGFSYNFHKSYHYSPTENPKYPGKYSRYPVMDISFEAAKLYCEWLTSQYNVQEGRKYKKVEIRLPSKNEWTMAALGEPNFQSWKYEENTVQAVLKGKGKSSTYELKNETVSYPWYGKYWELRNSILNNKNCYLANVKTSDEILCPAKIKGDGFEITSPVGTYFGNQIGLFDVIGNVAEMTDAKGVAMGGSWNHSPENSTIKSEVNYSETDTSVGFRLFMEVIEE